MKSDSYPIYMCDDCGNTSPIPNSACSQCGGKMSPPEDESTVANSDDDAILSEAAGYNEADESLEALKDAEDDESEREYQEVFQDTDNPDNY